jgi:D-alanyl-D-alanine carboxypeptidase/D-alanyl-D-alanine-endopeptidase (penicillin-binding protein 4)
MSNSKHRPRREAAKIHRALLAALCLVWLAGWGRGAEDAGQSASAERELRDVLDATVAGLEAEGIRIGALIERADSTALYAHNADEPFVLASNTKLLTTAAALTALPQNFRWRTSARVDGKRLWIVGGGDATFALLDGVSLPDRFLDELARQLKQRKTTRFSTVVLDARVFDDVLQHPLWPVDQLREAYAAPVSGLPYNRGLIQVRTPSGVVTRAATSPLDVLGRFLLHGLRKRGVRVQYYRSARPGETAPPNAATVLVYESPKTLAEIVRETNVNSDNYLAEHLFKSLGAVFAGEGSFPGGTRAVRAALEGLRVPLDGYQQTDGSGLARAPGGGDRATPRMLCALLRVMAKREGGEVFVRSLAVAGESGTLRRRFLSPPLRGRVRAKTGYIVGALTLSGYLMDGDLPVAVFSILANEDPAATTLARRERVRTFREAVLATVWNHLRPEGGGIALPATDAATPATAPQGGP